MAFFKKPLTLLVVITLLGAFLRFYHLATLPPSLNWDEVSHAYNAYSLYHTGKDQWGQILPIINFRAYGDYPTTLNLYFTIPFLAIFGLNDLFARVPHALVGTLLIPLVFIAAYRWRKNTLLGLFAALFTALDPWLLFTSRTILQSNWAVWLLTLALCFYFANKFRFAILTWGLSLLAYHNTRIFVPLVLTTVALRHRKHWLVASLVILTAMFIILSPASRARGTWVSLINPGSTASIEYQRNHSQLSPLLSKIIYNRPVYLITHLAQNYIGYFSPQFLFFSGGTQYQYSLPKFGLTPLFNLPFFYIGTVMAMIGSPLLFIWFLLSPLPAAITQDQFAVVRATTMLPLVQIFTALGVSWFIGRVPVRLKQLTIWSFLLAIIGWTGFYLYNYSTIYPKEYSSSWQYGYSQVVDVIKKDYSQYDLIIMTKKYGEPHEFVLWYWPWNNQVLINDPNFKWSYHDHWYWVDGFDKFRFVNDWEMGKYVSNLPGGKKYLVIAGPENPTAGEVMTTINFLDSKPAFIIKNYEK